jgi:hypothetical protein
MKAQTLTLILFIILSSLTLASCQPSDIYGLWLDLPPNSVLFQDDFTDPSSGWKNSPDFNLGAKYYKNGTYRIEVNSSHSMITSTPGLNFTDVRINVTTSKLSGPEDDIYGILCRWRDSNNYYFMVISSDGYYGIGKVTNGNQSLLGNEKMPPSDVINQGLTTNHLQADCLGDELSLYVNGQHLATVNDSAFESGDVGLLAGTFTETGSEVMFSNFIVIKP